MDHDPRGRTIATLVAIVQTMMPEMFCDAPDNTRRPFDDALGADDPLALAIAAALTPEEIDHAFAWGGAPRRSPDEALAALPVAARLDGATRARVRAAVIAHDAADAAFLAALGPRDVPPPEAGRALDAATGRFVAAMARAAGVVAPGEALAALPEPWRACARRELAALRERIETALGDARNYGAGHRAKRPLR